MSKPRTELQIMLQAIAALQLEIRAATIVFSDSESVHSETLALHAEAKELMQSALADADVLAITSKGPPSLEGRPLPIPVRQPYRPRHSATGRSQGW